MINKLTSFLHIKVLFAFSFVLRKEIVAKSGTFVNVPPNVTHSFKNKSNILAKMLIILAPGGMENLFVEEGVVKTNFLKTEVKSC